MKNQNSVVLKDHTKYSRKDFLSFTNEYYSMAAQLRKMIARDDNKPFPLCLGRVKDENFEIKDFSFIEITEAYQNHFLVKIKSDIEDGCPYLMQNVRLDNILGDVPVLPDYINAKLIEFGNNLPEYVNFQNNVRTYMSRLINQNLALYYQNDDMTISIVHTKLLEVNKSNFSGCDFHESLKANDIITHNGRKRDKYHRFISENGFLFGVCPSWAVPNQHDDGHVFPTPKEGLISLV
jgi:hypothetical protein